MKFIKFDDIVNKNNENYVNKSVFTNETKVYYLWLNEFKVLHLFYAVQVICDNNSTPLHVSNTIIIGQTGCSKTNLLFNIVTLNSVFQKIFISTKEPETLKKFPQDVKIFYQNDEYDLDSLIRGNLQTCCIFEDQLSDDKK